MAALSRYWPYPASESNGELLTACGTSLYNNGSAVCSARAAKRHTGCCCYSIEGNARIINREIPTQDHGGCIYTHDIIRSGSEINPHRPALLDSHHFCSV